MNTVLANLCLIQRFASELLEFVLASIVVRRQLQLLTPPTFLTCPALKPSAFLLLLLPNHCN